jgi:superfamily II DNA or RNA helicase
MAGLWSYWPSRELQEVLQEFDPVLMDDLEEILPAISGVSYNPTELYLKENLVKIVEAFMPADCFSKRSIRKRCLDRLPPDELRVCSEAVEVGQAAADFGARCEELSKRPWRGKFAQRFVNHFELPAHFLPIEPENRSDYHDLTPPSFANPIQIRTPFKQLKDFQFGVYHETMSQLATPRSRFVIQMPTGSGKTRTAMEVISDFLNSSEESTIVVWLAHSEELCEQAMQCFLDVWPHLARVDVRATRAWGGHPFPSTVSERGFIVAGFQKLHAALQREPDALSSLRERIGVVIVDEAHKTEAPTYKAVVQELIGTSTSVMGLTATPGRTVSEEIERLARFYFNSIIGIPMDNDVSVIQMLKRRRVLSNTTYEPIMTEIDVDLTPTEIRALEEEFDFPMSVLRNLGRNQIRNVEITRRLVSECEKGSRILFFACGVKHSMFITSLLIYLGYKAAHVDGSTPKAHREGVIEAFKSGENQVLCNHSVLSTGFDAPSTDVVFISRPTASPVLYSQMVGRGLRGPAVGGTSNCRIIDVRDNILGFGEQDRVYELFEDYWDK